MAIPAILGSRSIDVPNRQGSSTEARLVRIDEPSRSLREFARHFFSVGRALLLLGVLVTTASDLPIVHLGFCFLGFAEAAPNAPVPYSELKLKLSSDDVSARIAARRLLGDNFSLYKNDALADLYSKPANPNYTVSLLHGLIAGIDNETGGRLSPAQQRDLSKPLPFIANRLEVIVSLTGDLNKEIGKQALRLVERFPVDDFRKLYDEIDGPVMGDCKPPPPSDQLIRWGSIFFYYNRIIQFMYSVEALNATSRSEIDALTALPVQGTKCLDTEYKVDVAALFFARAVVFDRLKEPSDAVLSELKKFNKQIELSGGPKQYYAQDHFDTVHDLLRKYAAN
jgi:hypothetical protein